MGDFFSDQPSDTTIGTDEGKTKRGIHVATLGPPPPVRLPWRPLFSFDLYQGAVMARTDQGTPESSTGDRPNDGDDQMPQHKLVKTSLSGFSYIDYKETETLRRHLTNNAKLQARRRNNVSAGQQRMLARAIKRARFMGLLPYVETTV
jgi:small subunit ribosomal protein S18